MYIYIDLVFVINLVMDTALIWAAGIFLKEDIRFRRILLRWHTRCIAVCGFACMPVQPHIVADTVGNRLDGGFSHNRIQTAFLSASVQAYACGRVSAFVSCRRIFGGNVHAV